MLDGDAPDRFDLVGRFHELIWGASDDVLAAITTFFSSLGAKVELSSLRAVGFNNFQTVDSDYGYYF